MRLFADYHTHTTHSHGRGSVLDNVRAARAAGLQAVAISDHGPSHLFGVGVRSTAEFFDIIDEVKEATEAVPDIQTIASVEANVVGLDGSLDVPHDVLKRLDMVLVGLHHLVRPAGSQEAALLLMGNAFSGLSPALARRVRTANTKAIVEAVLKNPIDVVTHPGLQMPIDTDELARACAVVGTALEINTSHRNTGIEFIRTAVKQGAMFAINSDAHVPKRVGDLEYGIRLALKAGLTESDIINAYP